MAFSMHTVTTFAVSSLQIADFVNTRRRFGGEDVGMWGQGGSADSLRVL
jgi:hypothetical protein